ncbi:MAG: hypothetical protein QOD11_440 [Bradyrhizobium sp.]|jgi:hypothetical protein|nr:hypothetical protein [Bradyrhizobium sp.]
MPFVLVLGGCAIIPDVPPDFALPVHAILAQTACELQRAFIILDKAPELKRFKAKQWLVTVSLSPKTDTSVTLSGGLSRKSLDNPVRFTTWAMSGPGAQIDDKASRTSGINYNFKSAELMVDKALRCPPDFPSVHVLAQHLGVGEWLHRTASAMEVASSVTIDKPIYNTEITIKLSANGTYTYTFPPGTNLAAFGGGYTLDEQLNINMAPIADKQELSVTSLPVGQQFRAPVNSTVQVESAQNRLDLLGIEQAIRKLQTQ